MAEALKLGICDLVAEFLADALIFLGLFKAAWTVSAALLQTLLYGCDDFFIFVKGDSRFHGGLLMFFLLRLILCREGLLTFGDFIISHFLPFVCNKVTKALKKFLLLEKAEDIC